MEGAGNTAPADCGFESMSDDLDCFGESGASDRETCTLLRGGLRKISSLWMDVQKDFHQTIATCVDEADKDRAETQMEEFRGKYKTITTKGLQITGELFNTMERERTEKTETGQSATAAVAGAQTPQVDETLCPSYKAVFSLSMDKFRKWWESATAWGQLSNHGLWSKLMQKLHFEAICERSYMITAWSWTPTRRWWRSQHMCITRGSRSSSGDPSS